MVQLLHRSAPPVRQLLELSGFGAPKFQPLSVGPRDHSIRQLMSITRNIHCVLYTFVKHFSTLGALQRSRLCPCFWQSTFHDQ